MKEHTLTCFQSCSVVPGLEPPAQLHIFHCAFAAPAASISIRWEGALRSLIPEPVLLSHAWPLPSVHTLRQRHLAGTFVLEICLHVCIVLFSGSTVPLSLSLIQNIYEYFLKMLEGTTATLLRTTRRRTRN